MQIFGIESCHCQLLKSKKLDYILQTMGQPPEMFVLQNDIVKVVFQEGKKEKRRKRNNLPSNLRISPYNPHSVVVGKFSQLR